MCEFICPDLFIFEATDSINGAFSGGCGTINRYLNEKQIFDKNNYYIKQNTMPAFIRSCTVSIENVILGLSVTFLGFLRNFLNGTRVKCARRTYHCCIFIFIHIIIELLNDYTIFTSCKLIIALSIQ